MTIHARPYSYLILSLAFATIPGSPSWAQRPGDRQFPSEMNPAYSMINLLPPGFKPQVTGMDTLSDGRLVLSTREDDPYGYSPLSSGKIYLVSGHNTYSANNVTYKIIAEGLYEPMGLVVVHDTIYTITKQELLRFADTNKDGVYESRKTVCSGFPGTDDVFEWNFGLVYKDGAFYSNLSSHHNVDDAGQNTERGGVICMHTNGTFELLGTGIRRSNGVGLGPNNDVFTTDNQGEWVPTNRLIHAQKDKWWGYRNGPNYNPHKYPLTKPAIWMEYGSVARSPSQPAMLIQGPYRGQMITGDCTDPNIRRMFLEKVNGEYQGAVFHFAAMNKSPANRFLMGTNGDVIVGGLGSVVDGHSDWNWGGGVIYGLQVLRPTGAIPFDMLAVRAVKGGFDIEFTKPVGAGAENPGNYEIRTWGYISERPYSSPKQNEYGMNAASVKLNPDRTRAFLAINNLPLGNVVYIRLKEGIHSQTDEAPWVTEAWYTLNNPGTAEPFQVTVATQSSPKSAALSPSTEFLRFISATRFLALTHPELGDATVIIRNLRGERIETARLSASRNGLILSSARFPAGIYSVEITQAHLSRAMRLASY